MNGTTPLPDPLAGTGLEGRGPPLTNYYYNLFKNNPQIVGISLRRGFFGNDPNLDDILHAVLRLINLVADREAFLGFVANGILDTVLEIASTMETYRFLEKRFTVFDELQVSIAEWRRVHEAFWGHVTGFFVLLPTVVLTTPTGIQHLAQLTYLFQSLQGCIKGLQRFMADEPHPLLTKCARRYLAMAPDFALAIWKHRTLLLCSENERGLYLQFGVNRKLDSGAPTEVGVCLMSMFFLYATMLDLPPPKSSMIVDCLLYHWVYLRPGHSSQDSQLLVICKWVTMNKDSDVQALLDSTLSDTDPSCIEPDKLLCKFFPILQACSEYEELTLKASLVFLHGMSRHALTIPPRRIGSYYGCGVLENMFLSCQLQICSRGPPYDTSTLQLAVRTCWNLIERPQTAVETTAFVLARTLKTQLPVLLGHALVNAINEDNESDCHFANSALRWYILFTLLWPRERLARLKQHLYACCYRSWGIIRDKLSKGLLEPERSHDGMIIPGTEGASSRSTLATKGIRAWDEFGVFCGLTEANKTATLDEERRKLRRLMEEGSDDITSSTSAKKLPRSYGCCWAYCACSGHKPYHPLKYCRRCKVTMYCGEACQRKDWEEGGHKEMCLRAAKIRRQRADLNRILTQTARALAS